MALLYFSKSSQLMKLLQLMTTLLISPQVLTKLEHVFVVPHTLPPIRTHDHHIPLQPNQEPVSVRPYQYPYYQKAEIEKKVKEFLDSGLICPSTSPFSSSVLLVKKDDGGWWFCVDYRALNNITIKDKYLIPVIDKLLNELHGSPVFFQARSPCQIPSYTSSRD